MKFYHYVHCPFCQRVRLALSHKKIAYESIVLSYADAETPTALIGAKMLPIIDFGEGDPQAESLDLIAMVDDRYTENGLYETATIEEDLAWASRAAVSIPRYFDMLIPYMLDGYRSAAEFDEAGATYFKEGKEAKRGKTFEALKSERFDIFEQSVLPALKDIEARIGEGFIGSAFSAADCVLAADLSGLRTVEGIELPEGIVSYIEAVEKVCGDDLLSVEG